MTSPHRLSIVAGVCSLGILACHHAPPPAAPDRLWAHYGRGAEVVTAVIDGDLERARHDGRVLASEAAAESLSSRRGPQTAELWREALRIAEAGDIPTAAAAVGAMAKTCGDCHQARIANPRFIPARVPIEGRNAIQTQMQLHRWAADRMWDGLVHPSDSAWAWGSRMLAMEPLYQFDVGLRTGDMEQAQRLAQRVYDLGRRARTTTDPAARAGLYGEFLATCASCHTVARPRR
jgi:mono/diheme cytochrome c family protein